ncbi:hypothetical protein [Ornithinimicrobium faecis]|uniref:hypothetical protein n=1 Tax=Ornithinimicrobium faecis TaxID=2934158 RepID=UPI002117A474|nr:hypothetical protein [Ornithinimicrobium sp. HY1745]
MGKQGRRSGLVVAALATALTLTACGVSLEEEPSVEAAGDPGPSATAADDANGSADTDAETMAPVDVAATSSAPDDEGEDEGATDPGDDVSATSGPPEDAATEPTGGESVPILYAGPAAGAPEVDALGTMIQTPVESCLALYRDAVPAGAHLEPEPDVQNTESDLALRCSMLAPSGTVLFTGDVRIMPDQRDDQQVVVEAGGDEVLQRGHLRSAIYPISDTYPENHLSTITNVLERVGNSTIEPLVEQLPPPELADDLPTSYTQPGRNSEEVIRLYRLLKDPYAGCQHLLDGALPDGARIEDNPNTMESANQLILWCTVEAPDGLIFVAARSVVHPQTDTAVSEALAGDDVGWQEGNVMMTADVSGPAVDPGELLQTMHANLRTDF